MKLKKKQLEIFLQQVPTFHTPVASLEQYHTPASLVSDIIYTAFCLNDISEKRIVDLGCGTGIFAFGAAVGNASKVTGIDIDNKSIEGAKKFAKDHNLSITFLCQEISSIELQADTVLMNPPFGAQKDNKHADRLFMKKAIEIAPVIYSLHLSTTIPFIVKLITALNGTVTLQKKYCFPLKGTFSFHEKHVMNIDVTLVRTLRGTDE